MHKLKTHEHHHNKTLKIKNQNRTQITLRQHI